jgi:hypothetical protein
MAAIVKKNRKSGDKYYISYRCRDEQGNVKQHWLPCTDRKEAHYLFDEVAQAEQEGREYVRPQAYTSSATTAVQANRMTIQELLERYIDIARQHWSPNTLGNARHISADYIVPYIGNVPVAAVTPMYLQDYYNDLPRHKAVQGNRSRDPGNISARTIREVHKLLRPAFERAVLWGILPINPTLPLQLPKGEKKVREQWSEAEVVEALNLCDDPQLRAAIAIQFSATTRSGELLGLTWDCVDISDLDHVVINIDKSLARINRKNMNDTEEREIILKFPAILGNGQNSTIRVLKRPKTPSSIRKIYLSKTAGALLKELKAMQSADKAAYGDSYHDYNLVFSQHNGNPLEDKYMSRHFKVFLKKHNLHMIDFYALRHSGATAKLRSTRDLKAVQGDMGHATPEMLTKVYAAIVDEDRMHNAEVIEASVLSKIHLKS